MSRHFTYIRIVPGANKANPRYSRLPRVVRLHPRKPDSYIIIAYGHVRPAITPLYNAP